MLAEYSGVKFKDRFYTPRTHGVSHWEITDATEALAFISETPNPGQDHWRENPDPVYHPEYPLDQRVALQLTFFRALTESYRRRFGEALVFDRFPYYDELLNNGFAHYLK